ncbi:uncharacterized protein TM35_000451340 [Trypanosoma theileri]|uniref:Mucin TcMUCII n=1 Tax=Trypanosoma theileri TaxID=67003 RepID=A0A1X0NI76_9TRYP|nr:uncharacterized protein TM35_000451340 [Trypanosoma theileri]ORC84396.1 hypothetical protein TM35_000451340 [Trypanosoma theileri]
MMSRVLCFLTLLLSVVSLCVTAEAGSEPADGPCTKGTDGSTTPSGETCPATAVPQPPSSHPSPPPGPKPPLSVSPGGKACTQGKTDPTCSTSGREHVVARTDDCETSSEKKSCPNNEGETNENCRNDSRDACTIKEKTPLPEGPGKGPGNIGDENPHDRLDENTIPGADGHSNSAPGNKADAGSAAGTGGSAGGGSSPSEAATPAAPSTAGNSDAPSENPQHANNEASENATSPTTPSSSSSATTSDGGSNPTSTENDNTSSASESTSNPEGSADNTNTRTTTTTTTTTTLPPELTNNKKGDADSSSSSSSVWVRVPLLIVTVLFSFTVY